MEDVFFTRAAPEDLDAVVKLLGRCDLPTGDLSAAHFPHFTLCRVGGRLAGTVGLEPLGDAGLLRSLAVAPELRGRRLGHELWGRARAEASRLGIRRLYLLTTTAEALFARWGFRRVDRSLVPDEIRATHELTTLCPSTAAVMMTTVEIRPTG
jgi:amino-acid N-acetyltransferase